MGIACKKVSIRQRYSSLKEKEYVGFTGVSFKLRYSQHKYSLGSDKSNQTILSKFCKANRKDITQIKWYILHKVNEYISERSDNCSICNLERMAIAEMDI